MLYHHTNFACLMAALLWVSRQKCSMASWVSAETWGPLSKTYCILVMDHVHPVLAGHATVAQSWSGRTAGWVVASPEGCMPPLTIVLQAMWGGRECYPFIIVHWDLVGNVLDISWRTWQIAIKSCRQCVLSRHLKTCLMEPFCVFSPLYINHHPKNFYFFLFIAFSNSSDLH